MSAAASNAMNTFQTPHMVAEPGSRSRASSSRPVLRNTVQQQVESRFTAIEQRLDLFTTQTIQAFAEA